MPTDNETDRLQKRVDDLEHQLRQRRNSSGRRSDYYDDYTDVVERTLDEVAAVFRGVFRAGLEGVRVIADTTSDFSDEVIERNSADDDESQLDTFRRLPGDVSRSLSRAFDRGLDAPREAVDRFQRTYRDEPRRRTRRRAVDDVDYGDWSTSDLRREARIVDVSGYDSMSRNELVSALEKHDSSQRNSATRTSRPATTTETTTQPK